MPDHHQKHHDRRDSDRDYRRERGNEKYRQERSIVYKDEDWRSKTRDHHSPSHMQHHQREYEDSRYNRQQSMSTDTSAYETEHRSALYNLKYILTSRGLCQILEFGLNMLIVILAGVPYSNTGKYQDIASLGGLYYYYYGGAQAFTGQDLERVKQLDVLFYQLKLPPYIFTMACGGALMAYALAMLALGIFRVPFRWPVVLLVEALLDGLIGLGYLPAVAFYFIKLKETYNNAICKERESLYKSKGYTGNECSLSGTDIAGGILGVLGAIVFVLSAVLALRAFREVRKMKQQREEEGNNL